MISVYVHADHDFQMKSALERVSMSEKEMEKYIETNQQIPFRLLSLSQQEEAGMMQKIMTCASILPVPISRIW